MANALAMRMPQFDVSNTQLDVNPLMQAFAGIRQQRQQDVENQRAEQQLGMQRERFGLEKQRYADDREQKLRERAGNLALLTLQDADEGRRAANWKRFIDTHPNAAGLDASYHDPRTGPMRILADAGMSNQYLDYKLKAASAANERARLGLAQSAEERARENDRVRLGLAQSADARAAALHEPQLSTAQLQYQAAKRDFDTPKVPSADLGPDHSRVFYDPRTGQEVGRLQGPAKPPDSTARKAIYEAQDELPNLKSAVDALTEAKALLPNIMTGYGSKARAGWNQAAPGFLPNVVTNPETARATLRYDQIMSAEAIGAMSQTLKGATTDNEMRAFVSIMNDPNTPIQVKQRALDSMLTKAQQHYQNKYDRIRELGGRMPDLGARPGAGASAADPLGLR